MKIICIHIDNIMTELNIQFDNIINEINTLENKKGDENIKLIYFWNYDDYIIECYRSSFEKNNIKNNHVLACGGISNIYEENSEDSILYGNIYIVCKNKDTYIDYYISEYGNFYYIMNEYYNINSENELSEDDELDNNKNLNKCNELLYNIVNNNDSDNNLDIDDNNYT